MNHWDDPAEDESESFQQWNAEHYRYVDPPRDFWAWVTGVALVMVLAYLAIADMTNGTTY